MPTSHTQRASLYARFRKGLAIPACIYALFRRRLPVPEESTVAADTARPRRAATLMLGELLPWLIALGASVLSVVRGAFYGFVDHGPYDDSWGGPTRAGAWLAHFGIGLVTLCVAALILVGLGALRERLERPAYGHNAPRWAVTLAVFLLIFSVYLLGAWIAQI